MEKLRVKVQLTMDIDEVEVFIRKALYDEYNKVVDVLVSDFDEMLSTPDTRLLVNLIDDYRYNLAKLDNRLSECQTTLESYLREVNSPRESVQQDRTLDELNKTFCEALDRFESQKQSKERFDDQENI